MVEQIAGVRENKRDGNQEEKIASQHMEGKNLEETLGDTSVDLCPAIIISENEEIK